MLNKLNSFRQEREDGFSSVQVVVTIVIICILAAIAIPVISNRSKMSNDVDTETDMGNAITIVGYWVEKQRTNDTPVPSIDDLEIPVTEGVTLTLTGTSTGYCITGTHENGLVSSTTGYVFASRVGKVTSDGKACVDGELTESEVVIPE